MAPSLLLLLALLPTPPDSLRPLSPDRRLAITYANDFFFATDYYFTQGITLDWVSPVLARSPANYLLPRGPASSTHYHGLALRYDGYTPLSIVDKRIRVGDRPYAAYFYVSMYRINNQIVKKQRLTTALELGYIGPAAGGKLIQTKLHELTHYDLPQGWGYQIRSDAVLGYRATYEKQLLAAGRAAALIGTADASLGTLRTYAAAGLRLRAGLFDPYFASLGTAALRSRAGLRPWQVYAEGTLTEYLVGYDASLQGGLLNRSSPYVLKNSQIRRGVLHGTGSLVVAHKGLSFMATATFIGPEFAGGRRHRWGTLGLARAF
ncbi:lipid A deacylase LpxR family protein [Hymenobacter sp. H14-R3]|uniref:lipid A deacylase LpxR family protein n=1 Tax=Hymenobacter sp. H14-R3 TaxID=3046308 RepID=UPI0024B97E4F|nr:lipid A deacylase LpxR family protein [Hymenobacter sp. H14-R3]MDJ0367861.1 lipid A deacylase LpxR family protein [Hymenobacter sp. H14-R3]